MAPSKAIAEMCDEADHRVKLAKSNVKFLMDRFNISLTKLGINANIDLIHLEFILDRGEQMTFGEILRLMLTLNEMCRVKYTLDDYVSFDFRLVSMKV